MKKLILRWLLTTAAVFALVYLGVRETFDWKAALIAVFISTLIVLGDLGEYHVYY